MRLTADDVVELAEIAHAVGERHEAASSGTSSVTCSDVCSRRHSGGATTSFSPRSSMPRHADWWR